MATDRIQLQNLRSAEVLSGVSADTSVAQYFDGVNSPKLPTSDQLEFGEIALNYATGHETIAIKNSDGKIVYIPFNVAQKILEGKEALKESLDLLQGNIDEVNGNSSECLEKFNSLSGEVYNYIDNHVSGLTEQIEGLSEDIEDALQESKDYTDFYLENLSGETDNKIQQLDAKYTNEVNHLKESDKALNDRIDNLSDQINTSFDQSSVNAHGLVDELRKEVETFSAQTDNRFFGQNAKIEELGQEVDAELENINGKISDLTTLTEEGFTELEVLVDRLSGNTDSSLETLNQRIDNLSGSTDSKFTQVYDFLHERDEDVKTEVLNVSSAYTDSQISQSKSELQEEINSIKTDLQEKDIEHDNALQEQSESLEKLKSNLGLNEDGGYVPTFSEINGKTVVEAIDYLGETHKTEYEQLKQDVIDDELITAASVARINFELGFTRHAEYKPANENLRGRTVTEAIDYIYSDLKDCIISNIDNSKIDTLLKTKGWLAALKIDLYRYVSGQTQPLKDELGLIDRYLTIEDSGVLVKKVTYEQLNNLRNNGQLRPGVIYRLIDYRLSVNENIGLRGRQNSTANNNGFDILITAVSESQLNENVKFVGHNNVTLTESGYHENAQSPKYSAWEGKYRLDNDDSSFSWADTREGRGVIYYLKDERNNEAPYDFKNMLIKVTNNDGDIIEGFTFDMSDNNHFCDASVFSLNIKNNIIKPTYDEYNSQVINNIMIKGGCQGNEFDLGCSNILLSENCMNNKISNKANSSTIDPNTNNTFIGYNFLFS